MIVECLTDNRSRTAPEIRKLFKAGSLGQPGSVAFFFNHCGVVEATHTDANRDAETDAIEAGAQEVEPLEAEEVPAGQKGARFLTEPKELDHVAKALKARAGKSSPPKCATWPRTSRNSAKPPARKSPISSTPWTTTKTCITFMRR